ncbi:MAG TPA: hypothetical protein ENI62_08110 [Gammaproteobacteria bacterium]|nr:hypothetical protein [Gammaproteobacteria bacterium]
MNALALQQEFPSKPARQLKTRGHLLFPQQQLRLHSHTDHVRKNVESYIASRFDEYYGAKVQSFLPQLISAQIDNETSAAVGLNMAASSSLFLEQYLDVSLEQTLAAVVKQPIDRDSVVEIGNLTATRAGNSYLLFILLNTILDAAGYRWVTFTATRQVRRILGKLSCRAYKLCEAELSKLASDTSRWGSYYETQPEVLAVNIQDSMAILNCQRFSAIILQNYRETITILAAQLRRAA